MKNSLYKKAYSLLDKMIGDKITKEISLILVLGMFGLFFTPIIDWKDFSNNLSDPIRGVITITGSVLFILILKILFNSKKENQENIDLKEDYNTQFNKQFGRGKKPSVHKYYSIKYILLQKFYSNEVPYLSNNEMGEFYEYVVEKHNIGQAKSFQNAWGKISSYKEVHIEEYSSYKKIILEDKRMENYPEIISFLKETN